MQFLEKLRKMLENIAILNLSQQNEEETVWYCDIAKLSYPKFFTENLLAAEMKETKIILNKPVYFGLLTIELSKLLMYEFWYDYVKPKFCEIAKLRYMDTDIFHYIHKKQMVFIKTLRKMLNLDVILQVVN